MKKFFLVLFTGLLLSVELPAQGFLNSLNKALNGLTQDSQQRNSNNKSLRSSYERWQKKENDKKKNKDKENGIDNKNRTTRANKQEPGTTMLKEEGTPVLKQEQTTAPQSKEKVITLVVNGTGETKEDATKNALRSAIEQAFGTFVSANTEVLNDELIKDEITTVSTGNIKSYKELSVSQTSNGLYDASVQATVSIDQLTKFAQSKGMQAELAGASFIMNMKMRELNRKNEVLAINHMKDKVKAIASRGLFDYKTTIGEPKLTKNSLYEIEVRIDFCENANAVAFYETIDQTLRALSLSEIEQREYDNVGLEYYCYTKNLCPTKKKWGDAVYVLRNSLPLYREFNHDVNFLLPIVVESALNYEISDNLGNKIYSVRKRMETKDDNKLWNYINRGGNYTCEWYYIDDSNETLWFYELNPQNGLKAVFNTIAFAATSGMGYVFTLSLSWGRPDFYYQRFFIRYSEKGLSRLERITVKHR